VVGIAPTSTSTGRRATVSRPRAYAGFTLVELMVVVALLAVLTVVGVPSFRSFIVEQRARATVADLRIVLMTARSEAVKRNRDVDVLPAVGGWQNGWRIESPVVGDPDLLVHVQSGSDDIAITDPGVDVGFKASGRAENQAQFQVTVGSGDTQVVRCVILNTDGRTESVVGACS